MDEPPTTLILPWLADWIPGDGAVELRREIEERVPDADLRMTTDTEAARELIAEAEVVITNDLPLDVLEAAGRLEWVQTLGAGVDKYPLERLAERGVVLTNGAGVHSEPIAEQVLGYMLVFERRIDRGLRQQVERRWERYAGGELRGKTLGVVGLGSIGGRAAELGAALGMDVIGTKRDPSTAPEAADEAFGPDGLHEVLPRSDYLVLAVPLTEETRGLLGEDEFVSMKRSAVLVNVARGAVVEEDALIHALQNGRIRGAALDVFEREPLPPDSPLWDLSNVVVTPHMAGLTPRYWERLAELFAGNYRRFVAGDVEAFENRVDLSDR